MLRDALLDCYLRLLAIRAVRPLCRAPAALGLLLAAALSPGAHAALVTAVEYYHVQSEHYFVTVRPDEIELLDNEGFPGWYRTGLQYRLHDTAGPGTQPVCRYSAAIGGKPTHVFSASPQECEWLSTSPHWQYEGIAFHIATPDADGTCADGLAPVHRLYNNGRGGSPNHAYTPHADKVAELVKAGFALEGAVFCVPTSASDAAAKSEAVVGYMFHLPYWAWSTWDLRVTADAELPAADRPYTRVLLRGLPVAKRTLWGDAAPLDWYRFATGWDPLVDHYRSFEIYDPVPDNYYDPWVGTLWLFDDLAAPEPQSCAYPVDRNYDTRYEGGGHPFQPLIVRARWRDCMTLYWTPAR